MKKLLFSVLTSALLVALAGCGSSSSQAPQNNASPAPAASEEKKEQNLLEKVKADGKILIGTEGTYSPFTFHDQSGKLTGYDVEVVTEVAKRLGVEPVFQETQWDAMFAGLDSKRFDVVANQVGIRPDRQEKYDFSNPYTVSTAVLVTHKDNTTVKGFEDIKGLKAAQTLTSNLTDIAKKNGAEIVGVEGFNQAIDLLTSKRVDITINDGLSLLDFLKQKPDTPIKIVAKDPNVATNGFLFRKGSTELVEAFNKALDDMTKDGTLAKISEKWFGADVSK
ncbi:MULTISPECIES: amino acid ABC transporter substrate-binding protein [Brevibacillus]|jgi:cystine transport system substrate-binding protein|uniref:amino acid ABC transporter substrate-binding protein n=1 Tax=Brevibacillus TaxID=55080 RepID=UPI000EB89190|nr:MULTISPECIES: amino acid ABC transporter substrate-binding protein [Brevibacillus]MBU8714489.1 transporter substrate-binding domain-containing protein [Brevibacillus parabrevis]MDH6351291.1 cystine transport system substrate-binding protein [Brevibacillus sp. 1238]MDR4998670.1 amino acid ABC transporter substrate-binding protein [Brevibacillus parabrevis]MED2254803.1 amino acid ABC transporter substrate-binding protein [Brevibacillus parabrevis]NRQ54362.1 amino acid ABC transporter substrat